MKKLYCYVDETGQDTLGRLFIVAVVVTDEQRDDLERYLEQLETSSGKKKRKWIKARAKEQQTYIEGLLSDRVPARIYTRVYAGHASSYDELEVLAAAQALNLYRQHNGIGADDYSVTIIIDGLSKTMAARLGSEFRKLGVRTRKVIGARDESSATIRLADAIAGLVRDGVEGRQEYKALQTRLEKADRLHEL